MNKKNIFLYYLTAIIFIILYVFVNSTNLNPLYYEGALFYGVVLTIFIGISVLSRLGDIRVAKSENGMIKFDLGGKKISKVSKILVIGIWVFIIFMGIMSTVFFNVDKYKNQMPEAEVKEFTTDIQPLDISQIPIVDEALARQLAEKKLGERQSLGSQVYIGKPTIQTVNDKLVWAVPLHHSGFFKWLTNMDGTPGYIIVSATNTQDVQFVEGFKIKYHPNSYFFDDLRRHTRFKTALFDGITDYSFELDNKGQPYWVVTTYKNNAGFALPEATGIITVNASNGDTQKYSIDEVPEWVDRVQPEHFILKQINNKGNYIRGIFNFSNKDKYKTSSQHIIIYNNGKCYLFTGLTSVGSDESAIGFMMVDMVTKEPKMYQLSGATELAAQRSAEGKVQQYGYNASVPIILNVDAIPSYFMPLKDASGLIKQYAFVSVKDYLLVGVGETVDSAMNNYRKVLSTNGAVNKEQIEGLSEVQGKVVRISNSIENNGSVYRIIIDSKPDYIFIIPPSISEEISLTRDGDEISIKYHESTGDKIINVSSFDNLMFTQ